MEVIFEKPYPARAAVGVLSLPRNVCIEAEAITFLEIEVWYFGLGLLLKICDTIQILKLN